MKTLAFVSGLALVFLISTATAFSSDTEQNYIYGRQLYGIVLVIPEKRIGIWNIKGQMVEVTKETRIEEEQGKAEAGAFVEVIGKEYGNIFKAYKIEVKIPKRPES